ncbi:hypothetical protein GR247_41420 [Rhizobium leguminosarum]|nr:hypothetical protein [Rhizobium leguminosarum]
MHRRNLRPTRQAGNRSPVNVTIPNDFLDSFVDDELLVARIKAKSPR